MAIYLEGQSAIDDDTKIAMSSLLQIHTFHNQNQLLSLHTIKFKLLVCSLQTFIYLLFDCIDFHCIYCHESSHISNAFDSELSASDIANLIWFYVGTLYIWSWHQFSINKLHYNHYNYIVLYVPCETRLWRSQFEL